MFLPLLLLKTHLTMGMIIVSVCPLYFLYRQPCWLNRSYKLFGKDYYLKVSKDLVAREVARLPK